MVKKILLSSYMHGNMEALIDYYRENLEQRYKGELELIYLDLFEINKLKKLPRYFRKFIESMKTYDMVISDYASMILKTGKKVIFMDHGYGLKSMPGLDEINDPNTIKLGKIIREKVDCIITLSERDEKYFYKLPVFEKYKLPKYIPLGQPRNDILFDSNFIDYARKDIRQKFKLKDEKILLYAPTWRGYNVSDTFPFKREDFEKLNVFLKESGWKFFYRPHYLEDIVTKELVEGLDNIVMIDVNAEPYTQKILAGVDMVVTDYSSIIVDYLIVDKPIAFVPFDLKKYDDFRGIVVDFNNDIETPGPKVTSMGELMDYIEEVDSGNDSYESFRKQAVQYYYSYFDNKSCKRIWELVLKYLNVGQNNII